MVYIYTPPPEKILPGLREGWSRAALGFGKAVYGVYTHIAWI